MSNPNSALNYSHASAIRTATGRAASSVTISYGGGVFTHSSNSDPVGTRPKVVFSKDGLTLGCTFLTNQALDRLVEVYTDYKTGSRVIQ